MLTFSRHLLAQLQACSLHNTIADLCLGHATSSCVACTIRLGSTRSFSPWRRSPWCIGSSHRCCVPCCAGNALVLLAVYCTVVRPVLPCEESGTRESACIRVAQHWQIWMCLSAGVVEETHLETAQPQGLCCHSPCGAGWIWPVLGCLFDWKWVNTRPPPGRLSFSVQLPCCLVSPFLHQRI